MSTRVGIVGSGIVGQTLANGFVKHGYDVTIGTNTASKREELRSKTNGQVKVGSFEDAAKFGEIVVVATKGTAAEAALTSGRHCQSQRQDRHRHHKPDRRCGSSERSLTVLHLAE